MIHVCTDKFFLYLCKNIYISCSLTESDSYLYVNSGCINKSVEHKTPSVNHGGKEKKKKGGKKRDKTVLGFHSD